MDQVVQVLWMFHAMLWQPGQGKMLVNALILHKKTVGKLILSRQTQPLIALLPHPGLVLFSR